MAETEAPVATDLNPVSDIPEPSAEDETALKKRLLSRIAVAGVVILGLLGGLAIFDALNQPEAPALPKMASARIETPSTPPAAEPAAAPPAATEPAREEKTEPPAAEKVEPARPEPVAEAPKAAKPLTPPATPRTASIKPTPPAATPAKPDTRHEVARAVPERTTSAYAMPSAQAPAAAAPAAPATAAPATSPGPGTSTASAAHKTLAPIVEGAKRLLLQVGVFNNHLNAEDLVAKLQAAGIPAYVESRVQVGPFATRAEADAARAKLKGMGIDEGLLVRR